MLDLMERVEADWLQFCREQVRVYEKTAIFRERMMKYQS